MHEIHAVLQSLLVEAKGLSGQLEPYANHVAHIHQALMQICAVNLRRHKLNEAAQLVRQRARMTARLITLVQGLLLHADHKVYEQRSNRRHDRHEFLTCELVDDVSVREQQPKQSFCLSNQCLHLLAHRCVNLAALLQNLNCCIACCIKVRL